jgi:signal transduction histidine kinase
MSNPLERYRQNPFIRSTVNVMIVQAALAVLTLMVFFAAIWNQQDATRELVLARRAAYDKGYRLTPESLTSDLRTIRNHTLASTSIVIVTLTLLFGYLSARYALNPTRNSLQNQRRFIGNIAHELRTPLAIIRTNTEVALMDRNLSDYSRQTFRTTMEEIDRISGIINNLLSFDALTRPGVIRFEPLLLRDVANIVVQRHIPMAQEYGISIAVDASSEPAYVMGNAIALEQAVTNLVKNALNYTSQHDGRSVVVRIDDKGEVIALSVIDTGIGISQRDLYSVFQPYYRGDTSRERGIGSGTSGLGLAIVNDIVRAHNGHITVRSALNRGTTIELTFPKADTREHVKQVAAQEDDGEEHEEKIS